MHIFVVLRKRGYAALGAIASAAMFIVYPYAQTLGNNIDLWFQVITPLNFGLYIAFSALFGPFLALQAYNLKHMKACSLKRGATSGIASSILSFAAIQCPGCVSLATLFLPISATTFLAANNTIITGLSLAMLLFGMHMLGAFRDSPLGEKPGKPKRAH